MKSMLKCTVGHETKRNNSNPQLTYEAKPWSSRVTGFQGRSAEQMQGWTSACQQHIKDQAGPSCHPSPTQADTHFQGDAALLKLNYPLISHL